MTTPGASSSADRGHGRWERFQDKTGIHTRWQLAMSLAGAVLIVGILGWGIIGWVEMQLEAAAVISDRNPPLESLTEHVSGLITAHRSG